MPDTNGQQLTGETLRRVRLEQRMKKVRLAELMDVDPRTVARWESASTVPPAVVPGLRQHLPLDSDTERDTAPTDLSERADGDIVDALQRATPEQLLREIANRIGAMRPPSPDLPPAPAGRYRLSKDKAPSRRVDTGREQRKPGQRGRS